MASAKAKMQVKRVKLDLSYKEARYLKSLLNCVVGPDNGPRGILGGIWHGLDKVRELEMFYLEETGRNADLRIEDKKSSVANGNARLHMRGFDE